MIDMHQKRFLKILDELSYGRNGVLNDWAEMTAIALSNAVMPKNKEWTDRETRYMQIVKQYKKEQLKSLSEMFACVADSLTGISKLDQFSGVNLHDCLGEMYMEKEMRSRWDSDVAFTPFGVSYMMAKMTFGDNPIPEKGYLTIGEPACGTGGMIIAAAQALKDLKINYQQSIHVTAVDIRAPLAHMAYIQFSLLHIPAVVIHGDSLSNEEWSRWRTPAHVLGFWEGRIPKSTLPVVQKEPQFTFNFEKEDSREGRPVVEKRRKQTPPTLSRPKHKKTSRAA